MTIVTPDLRQIQQTIVTKVTPAVSGDVRVVDHLPEKIEPPCIVVDFPEVDFDTGEPEPEVSALLLLLIATGAGAERAQQTLSDLVGDVVPAVDSQSGDGVCAMRVVAFRGLTSEEVAAVGYWGGRIDLRVWPE